MLALALAYIRCAPDQEVPTREMRRDLTGTLEAINAERADENAMGRCGDTAAATPASQKRLLSAARARYLYQSRDDIEEASPMIIEHRCFKMLARARREAPLTFSFYGYMHFATLMQKKRQIKYHQKREAE